MLQYVLIQCLAAASRGSSRFGPADEVKKRTSPSGPQAVVAPDRVASAFLNRGTLPSYILENKVRESLPGRRKWPDYEGRNSIFFVCEKTRILPSFLWSAESKFSFCFSG